MIRIYYPIFGDTFDADELMKAHSGSWERLRGYAGWLMTESGFLQQRDTLLAQWENLTVQERPSSPFVREALDEPIEIGGKPLMTQAKSTYLKGLRRFLDAWNLAQLTTWDLPLPFGPILTDSFWTHTQAIPQVSVQVILPVHYPLTTTDEFLLHVQAQQQRVAQEHGLDPSVAGLPHYNVLSRMFEVQHLESVIRSRFRHRTSKKGVVTALEAAIAAASGISVEQVAKLRKAISACRRGMRRQVGWLRKRAGKDNRPG